MATEFMLYLIDQPLIIQLSLATMFGMVVYQRIKALKE